MADNQISRRAKANLPTVLLTLLSIVQALALEMMWSHLGDREYLYSMSFIAVFSWLQITASLLGVLLIWLVYSNLVMRFSWVPTTTDAVFPFLVGIIEFAQISALGVERVGLWFGITGVLFLAMAWISQVTMRRARLDGDNDEFFNHTAPATWRDHLMSLIPSLLLTTIGLLLWIDNNQSWPALLAVLLVIGLLSRQLWLTHIFTERSYRL